MSGEPEQKPAWEPLVIASPDANTIDGAEEERLRRIYGLPPLPPEGDGGAAG